MRSRPLFTAAVFSLAACATPPDPATVRAELLEADRAFARNVAERGADAWVETFADSGMMFGDRGPLAGRDSVRSIADAMFEDTSFTLAWEPILAVGGAAGDLGYTVGRWESSRRQPDGTRDGLRGSYVTIWRRQADGSWKVALDIGNPDASEGSEK